MFYQRVDQEENRNDAMHKEFQQLKESKKNLDKKKKEGEFFWKYAVDKKMMKEVTVDTWFRTIAKAHAKCLREYILNGRFLNRCYLDAWFQHPELGRGFQSILKIRVSAWVSGNSLWTGREQMAKCCPCCRDPGKETLKHYIMECNQFEVERAVMMQAIQSFATNQQNPGNEQNPQNPGNEQNPQNPGNEQNPQNPGNEQNQQNPGNEQNPQNPIDEENPQNQQNPIDEQNQQNPQNQQNQQNEKWILRVLGMFQWEPILPTPDGVALEDIMSTIAFPVLDSDKAPRSKLEMKLITKHLNILILDRDNREREVVTNAAVALARYFQSTYNKRWNLVNDWIATLKANKRLNVCSKKHLQKAHQSWRRESLAVRRIDLHATKTAC